MLLSVVQLADQSFTEDQRRWCHRKTLKCEIGRKGHMNIPFHCAQHEVGSTADGNKSFCTLELVFQNPNYRHKAIGQHLDLFFFKLD